MPKPFIQLSGFQKFSEVGRSKCVQALEHSNQNPIGYVGYATTHRNYADGASAIPG